jgi:trehalose 6-phosphate synthase/phosphatase
VDVSSCDDYVSRGDLQVFTCTVGKKPSAAANYLHDVNEVQELMDSLVKVSARDRQFSSATDLSSFDAVSPVNQRLRSISATEAYDGNVDETLSSGISKSMSLSVMKAMKGNTLCDQPVSDEIRVSGNLKEFMRKIKDEEDEDAVFF